MMPPSGERLERMEQLAKEIDAFIEKTPELQVAPNINPESIRKRLAEYDFSSPRPLADLLRESSQMLTDWSLHVTHPRYFGLFNPSVTLAGIMADALVAAFNSQLGAYRHNPGGVEIEQHVIRFLGSRFGWPPEETLGCFTSGGSEANSMAVLMALAHHFPDLAREGVRALPGQPILYVSEEGHHSFEKTSQQAGLGKNAVRPVPVDDSFLIRVDELEKMIREDREKGRLPFLVVGTAGSTRAGTVDPLNDIASVCARENLTFHVDAAWGGAAVLSDTLRGELQGIEKSDTITFDPHKWLSVPMACGVVFTRDPNAFHSAFGVDADYVPQGTQGEIDWYQNSPQWSRRFIGFKLFLSLAEAGLEGYQAAIDHQARMGDSLRQKLGVAGWEVINKTRLPLVCWVDPEVEQSSPTDGRMNHYVELADAVVARGKAWISTVMVAGRPALRACITSYLTQESDLDILMEELVAVRQALTPPSIHSRLHRIYREHSGGESHETNL